jgi:hypothetical protein
MVNARWIERSRPQFERFNAPCPSTLNEIYATFLDDEACWIRAGLSCWRRSMSNEGRARRFKRN